MRLKAKLWIAVCLRAALIACCLVGVQKAVFPAAGGFLSSEKLLYYTYQSNLWALVMTIVYFAFGIAALVKGSIRVPRALQIARYTVAVSITITFLVFWGLLSPVFRTQDLLTLNNQLLHTVVPVLFVADFLLFDRGKPMGRLSALWAAFLPFYYLVFSLVYAAVHPDYHFLTGGRYAYFFLDLDKYGWLGTKAGMGVLWWTLLLLALTLVIGYLCRFIQSKTIRTE